MKFQKPQAQRWNTDNWAFSSCGDLVLVVLVVLETLDEYEQVDINHDATLIFFFDDDRTLARIVSPEANFVIF